MSATARLTQSGARMSRGAYSNYQTEAEPGFPFGDACPNAWFMSVAQADDLASMDDEDQWMRLWYAPRILRGKHVW